MVSESVAKGGSEEASPTTKLSQSAVVQQSEERAGICDKEDFIASLGNNEKLRIVKNVVVLGIASWFTLQPFTALRTYKALSTRTPR